MPTNTKEFDKQIPLLLRLLENALRSGYDVKQSLNLAAEELTTPAKEDVQQVIADFESGMKMPEVFSKWLKRTPSHDLNLVIATILVQLEVGGNLADKFKLLGQIMEKRIKLRN